MSEQQQRSQQTNINLHILSGHLARDPQVRKVGEQTFCTITIVSNYPPYVDRQGNTVRPKPYSKDCELVGQMAVNAGKHLVKGQAVEITGEPRLRSWEDPRYASEADPQGRRFKEELFVRTINYGNKPQSWWNAQRDGTAATEQPQVEGGTPAPAEQPAQAEQPVEA